MTERVEPMNLTKYFRYFKAVNILYFTFLCNATNISKPNVVIIVADDLGWNDVGFHGSSEIPTPNIDSMAYSGIILNNYYVNPICTPSRSALMTGKYPIHTGMQHGVLGGSEPRGLPLTEKLLPEYLKQLGYANHMVGKWHLGSYKKKFTPTLRGFDSHLGFWTGHQDYFDHTAEEAGTWGLDMRKNLNLVKDLHGLYSTDIFTKEALKIINSHNASKPLFLYMAHAAVHSGNTYNPLPAPDSYVAKFSYIKNYTRQRFAGMLSKLDESFGDIIDGLSNKNILNNSIIIFTTDNGEPAAGFNQNAASNYPLRGVKDTLWEGGIRGTAFVWSPLLNKTKRISNQLMHVTDWLPTILEAVGGLKTTSFSSLNKSIDGVNMWQVLSDNTNSKRNEILHNIDDILGIASMTHTPWKYLKGESYSGNWSGWYGPSGRNYLYNYTELENSKAYKSLESLKANTDRKTIKKIRKAATIQCGNFSANSDRCKPAVTPCIFNIELDPCEKFNLAKRYPNVLRFLEEKLQGYNKTALPPGNLPRDPRGDPKFWDYAWVNFGDYI